VEEAPPNTTGTVAWTGSGQKFDITTPRAQARLESGAERISLSPMEAMLAAVAGCMAIDVVEILSKMRRPPSSYSIDCEGWRAESQPRRFTRIRLIHRAAGPALDEGSVRRAVDLSQEKYCSAMASLDPAIVVENEIVLSRKEEAV
jgi:putative redox protein